MDCIFVVQICPLSSGLTHIQHVLMMSLIWKISKNKIIIMTTHFFPCAGMKFEANNPSLEVSAFDLLATVYQCHHHCAEISEPSTCIFSKRLSLYRVFWNEIRPAHVGMTQGEIVSTPVGGRNMCPPTSLVSYARHVPLRPRFKGRRFDWQKLTNGTT